MAAHPRLDVAMLLSTLLMAQSEAQLAQMNATHAKLIAFQTATAQALAAKSGDMDSKLTAAKRQILQACAGMPYADTFIPEAVYHEMDSEGGTVDAVARILRKRLKPIPLSPHKTNIHVTPELVVTSGPSILHPMETTPMQDAQRASPSLRCRGAWLKQLTKTQPKTNTLLRPH
jgi:hypothetical protein